MHLRIPEEVTNSSMKAAIFETSTGEKLHHSIQLGGNI